MKLIMAVSKEGYVTRCLDDDMSWTGPSDKTAFRLLTCVGGHIACGSRTWDRMPHQLPGRHLVKLSTSAPIGHETPTLDWFEKHHPDGWLIGGQTIALEALKKDLVDQAFIVHSSRLCFPTASGDRYTLGSQYHLHEDYQRHNPRWRKSTTLALGDVEVAVWNRQRL